MKNCKNNIANICDFDPPVIDDARDGDSNTVIVFGVLKSQYKDLDRVILREDQNTLTRMCFKISLDSTLTDNSLEVERIIIQQVFRSILANHNSCNTIWPIGTLAGSMNQLLPSGNNESLRKSILNLQKRGDVVYSSNPDIHILAMNRGSLTLAQLLFPNNDNDEDEPHLNFTHEDFVKILFQVYFTLLTFQRLGLNHNDMYGQNVMILQLHDKTERFHFVLPKSETNSQQKCVVSFDTRFIVQIYDADCATMYYRKRNIQLDLQQRCEKEGKCSAPHIYQDIAGFNMWLYRKLNRVNRLFDRYDDLDEKDQMQCDMLDTLMTHLMDRAQTRFLRADIVPQGWVQYAVLHDQMDAVNTIMSPLASCQRLADNFANCFSVFDLTSQSEDVLPDCHTFTLPAQTYVEVDHPSVYDFDLSDDSAPGRVFATVLKYDDVNNDVSHLQSVTELQSRLDELYPHCSDKDITKINNNSGPSYRALDKKQHVKDIIYFEHLIRDTDSNALFKEWHAMYQLWDEEIHHEFHLDWSDQAFNLLQAVRKHTNLDYVIPHNLYVACLLLSCPMYYGLNKDARNRMRKSLQAHAEKVKPDQFEQSQQTAIEEYEKALWKLWNGNLPIFIPILYHQ